MLSLGPQANALELSMTDQYPECFQGLGKLKNYQAKMYIDPEVRLVAHSPRKIPFSLRSKVQAKIKELLEVDVFEKVDGPTPWVIPICVLPKCEIVILDYALICERQIKLLFEKAILFQQSMKSFKM